MDPTGDSYRIYSQMRHPKCLPYMHMPTMLYAPSKFISQSSSLHHDRINYTELCRHIAHIAKQAIRNSLKNPRSLQHPQMLSKHSLCCLNFRQVPSALCILKSSTNEGSATRFCFILLQAVHYTGATQSKFVDDRVTVWGLGRG